MTSIILRLISTPTNDISLKPRNTVWYKVFIYYTSVEGGYIYGYSGFREKILSSGMRQTAAIVVYDVVVNGLRLVPYTCESVATKCLQLRYIKSVYEVYTPKRSIFLSLFFFSAIIISSTPYHRGHYFVRHKSYYIIYNYYNIF